MEQHHGRRRPRPLGAPRCVEGADARGLDAAGGGDRGGDRDVPAVLDFWFLGLG